MGEGGPRSFTIFLQADNLSTQKDGGSATLEASARPTDACNYPTRHCVTKPAPRQEGLTHQEIRVGPRGTVEALDASPLSPTCPDNTKPQHQPAPGRVRPGFGMEDGSVELPTTPWKNAPACLGQLAGALGGSPMACHPDPPRNAWNIIPKHFPKLRPLLSRLFDARGRGPEGPVPNPSPDRHAATRSRRESSSSSPPTADGFGTGTPVPSPQSQSFSRGYGSILPTSLAYIVPSTRGCSPWRPDAVMSTTGRGRHSVLRIFKGRRGRTGHHATCGALPAAGPYLRLSRFQGGQAICTDDRSARAHAPGFAATAAPSYSSGPGPCPDGRVSAQLGTVTQLPVHPASPVLLTKNGPLGALDSVAWLNKAATPSYLFKNSPAGSSYPEGNFGGNQLLDGSISLSPLYPSQTNDLHVCSHSNPSQKIRVGRRCNPQGDPTNQLPCALRVYLPADSHTCQTPWSVFQDGPNGEPAGRRPEHVGAEAHQTARASNHYRDDDVSMSMSTARAWATVTIRVGPCPKSIGGPALAVPHPTEAHLRPPSASL
ncbi:hypothetical protein TanjilG_08731, partial [Lupinus angustifolius]